MGKETSPRTLSDMTEIDKGQKPAKKMGKNEIPDEVHERAREAAKSLFKADRRFADCKHRLIVW